MWYNVVTTDIRFAIARTKKSESNKLNESFRSSTIYVRLNLFFSIFFIPFLFQNHFARNTEKKLLIEITPAN